MNPTTFNPLSPDAINTIEFDTTPKYSISHPLLDSRVQESNLSKVNLFASLLLKKDYIVYLLFLCKICNLIKIKKVNNDKYVKDRFFAF